MQIRVRGRNVVLSDDDRAEVERRLRYALDRFEHKVREVLVDVHDTNGPRGGDDTVCRVACVLRHGGTLRAEHVSDSALASAANAAWRIRQRLAKAVELDKGHKGAAVRAWPSAYPAASGPVPDDTTALRI